MASSALSCHLINVMSQSHPMTTPADKEALSTPSPKRRRVKRRELSMETNILRDFVPSHELPSIDKLFDELVQQ